MLRDHVVNCSGASSDEWIGIHCNGIHTYPLECIRNGLDTYPLDSIAYHWTPVHGRAPSRDSRKGGTAGFHYNPVNAINHRR